MNRVAMVALAVLCLAGGAISQTPVPSASASPAPNAKDAAASPAFEVVDVHPSAHTRFQRFMQGGRLIGDRYAIKQATIPDLVANAYGVDVQYVTGGPTWLDMEHYDVIAKAAP